MDKELWKVVKNYEGLYWISNIGTVKNKKGKLLKPRKNKNGYFQVNLSKDNKGKNYYIHRLVAIAFLKNENNCSCINHKDENKLNNCVNNLEWCSYSYNNNYGTMNNLCSKKVIQYDKQGNFIKKWESANEIERNLKISHSSVSRCCRGKLKSANGYIFKYEN